MKHLIVAALLATAVIAAEPDYDAMFAEFSAAHLKAYADPDEAAYRKRVFITNMKTAEVLNTENPLAEFGVNEFADETAAEFSVRHNAEEFFRQALLDDSEPLVTMPLESQVAAAGTKVDWRAKGVVSAMKNQGKCGSCWAFSVTGNIESRWAIAGNPLVDLSQQQLVSCDKTNHGCGGGFMIAAYKWYLNNRKGKVATAKSYPYTSGPGNSAMCMSSQDSLAVGAVIKGYEQLAKNEKTIQAYVAEKGPVSVGLDARSFKLYRNGILTGCKTNQLNHAVIIVGFDDKHSTPYWIVRNSWGTGWGEKGYIRIAMGGNQCGINQYVTSAKV